MAKKYYGPGVPVVNLKTGVVTDSQTGVVIVLDPPAKLSLLSEKIEAVAALLDEVGFGPEWDISTAEQKKSPSYYPTLMDTLTALKTQQLAALAAQGEAPAGDPFSDSYATDNILRIDIPSRKSTSASASALPWIAGAVVLILMMRKK